MKDIFHHLYNRNGVWYFVGQGKRKSLRTYDEDVPITKRDEMLKKLGIEDYGKKVLQPIKPFMRIYIYFIQAANGLIKIGYANNLSKRFSCISRVRLYPLNLLLILRDIPVMKQNYINNLNTFVHMVSGSILDLDLFKLSENLTVLSMI